MNEFLQTPYRYVFVRKDLSGPQITVQACHAVLEAEKTHPYEGEHPHLIVFGIDNEIKLTNIYNKIKDQVKCFAFYEPDIGNQLTAFATEIVAGEQRNLFKKYQLLK